MKGKSPVSVWSVLIRGSWAVLGILAIAVVASLFFPRIGQYQQLQQKKSALEADIRTEETQLLALKRQQERLRGDSRFAERIAREEFGLAKPGETVFRFVED